MLETPYRAKKTVEVPVATPYNWGDNAAGADNQQERLKQQEH